jgi:hypothetical protein
MHASMTHSSSEDSHHPSSQGSQAFQLSLSESFSQQRFSRCIDECNDVKELRSIAKVLLSGWYTQRAASRWIMNQALQKPTKTSI